MVNGRTRCIPIMGDILLFTVNYYIKMVKRNNCNVNNLLIT